MTASSAPVTRNGEWVVVHTMPTGRSPRQAQQKSLHPPVRSARNGGATAPRFRRQPASSPSVHVGGVGFERRAFESATVYDILPWPAAVANDPNHSDNAVVRQH
jgi:hypothetical protein